MNTMVLEDNLRWIRACCLLHLAAFFYENFYGHVYYKDTKIFIFLQLCIQIYQFRIVQLGLKLTWEKILGIFSVYNKINKLCQAQTSLS